ncbi:nitrous oxide reductase family maturation protein NosD [Mesonia sp. HuA40]|uniref:nitrous oxide reductase family maturation protein NosD n=1 Tax=Mesonia sp. HuA40 TaxID=2602761 RepID=UPI0011CC2CAA|nr:nitrous oxide reductase family maturation protein NosD [Mesonia sp. HuA40]TXK73983.1 nitrous oxide reductase family maturation protein NosD [Mesonia sp. HuA40]
MLQGYFKSILFIVFFFTGATSLYAQIEVCENCSYSSIKKAVAEARSGDTIHIKKGTYRENKIIIDKPLYLKGYDYPVIDGLKKADIINVFADSVRISGIKLINVGASYTEDYAAIRVSKAKNFILEDLILEKIFFGIYLEKASDGIVRNNKILGDAVSEHNSGNGIQLWYSKRITVKENLIQKVRDGIYLEFADHCIIEDNISKDNLRYGLHFMFSNDDAYAQNVFENNGAGVAVMFSKRIEMRANQFRYNWGTASYGLLLKEINDAEIVENIFEENTTGINIEGSNRVNYLKNTFKNNGWAVKVRGACYENKFLENNFLYNSFDVSYNSKLNNNLFLNNYWSSYTGYDLDEDGFGDVPYRPVKLFSYIVNRTPETIILMRSLFVDIIDFSEKVSPVFTPDNLVDKAPLMRKK